MCSCPANGIGRMDPWRATSPPRCSACCSDVCKGLFTCVVLCVSFRTRSGVTSPAAARRFAKELLTCVVKALAFWPRPSGHGVVEDAAGYGAAVSSSSWPAGCAGASAHSVQPLRGTAASGGAMPSTPAGGGGNASRTQKSCGRALCMTRTAPRLFGRCTLYRRRTYRT